MPRNSSEFSASQALQLAYTQTDMVKEKKLQLAQSLGRSRPLARRSLWHMKEIPQKLKAKKLLVSRLAQMIEGWRKEDPPTKEKFPVGIDVP